VQLQQAWTAVERIMSLELGKVGLSHIKAFALWVCQDYKGPLTPTELARVLSRESNSIVQLLARMEKEGLVTRIPKRKGHPFTEIQITDKGRGALRPAIEVIRTLSANVLSALSDEELKQWQALLRKVQLKALQEMRLELAPLPAAFCGNTKTK